MGEKSTKPALARAVVGGRHVCLADQPAAVGKPRPATEQAEPKVEVIRDGNLVRAVEVVCPCGERIRIRFDYD
jgi:hypothetical protein